MIQMRHQAKAMSIRKSVRVNSVFYYEIDFDNMPGTYWGTVSPDRLSATASYKQSHYLTC